MKYIDEYLEYLEVIKKHSENTIVNYRVDLLDFYNYVDGKILSIDRECINKYLEELYKENVSKSSISRHLSSLRNFYEFLRKDGKISVNYFSLIKNPRKDNGLPKFVVENDIDRMFMVPDIRNEYGQRNLLIMRMLYATGVRISELLNIEIKDININDRTIRILGKGSKERIVVFGNNTKEILELYLASGRYKLDKKRSKYLFLNKDGDKLSSRYVRKMLDDVIIKASIDMHISPHMLRHTFATGMLNNGADLVSVKDLLGHESLNTTSIYTHVSDDMIREVYNKAHPRAR